MLKNRNKQPLPKSVRQIVYSYLPLNSLIKAISKLSWTERKILVQSAILDQPRSMKITFRDDFIYDINSLKYMMKLLICKRAIKYYTQKINFKIDSSSAILRSNNSSSPILKTNSEVANQIFQQEIDELSDSNVSLDFMSNDGSKLIKVQMTDEKVTNKSQK